MYWSVFNRWCSRSVELLLTFKNLGSEMSRCFIDVLVFFCRCIKPWECKDKSINYFDQQLFDQLTSRIGTTTALSQPLYFEAVNVPFTESMVFAKLVQVWFCFADFVFCQKITLKKNGWVVSDKCTKLWRTQATTNVAVTYLISQQDDGNGAPTQNIR